MSYINKAAAMSVRNTMKAYGTMQVIQDLPPAKVVDRDNYCLFCGAKMKEDKEPQWVRYEKSDIVEEGEE